MCFSDRCPTAKATIRGVISRGCACSVAPTTLSFGNVIVGDTSPSQTFNLQHQSGIKGLRGQIRVLSGDFVTAASYTCCATGTCGLGTNIPVSFRPTRLGPQTGKIVVENMVGCLGPGAGTVCDTLTVTRVGVTAATGK